MHALMLLSGQLDLGSSGRNAIQQKIKQIKIPRFSLSELFAVLIGQFGVEPHGNDRLVHATYRSQKQARKA